MHNQDTCVYMATGSGKSLCFQLPAVVSGKVVIVASTSDNCMTTWWLDIIKWQRWGNNLLIDFSLLRFWTFKGWTFKTSNFKQVSPLISLMKEQVSKFNENAKKRGAESPHGTEEVFRVDHGRQVFFPGFPPSLKRFLCLWGRSAVVYFSPGYIKVWSLVNRAGWYLTVGCIVPTNCKQDWSWRRVSWVQVGAWVDVREGFLCDWIFFHHPLAGEREIGKLLCIKKGSQQLQ